MNTVYRAGLGGAAMLLIAATPLTAALPDWALGPFARPSGAEPVIKPKPASVFACPMRKETVHWEATHTFNPAAVVKDNRVFVLYRAEDESGNRVGGYTSRLGLAYSDDGIRFNRHPEPVLFPLEDDQRAHEWEGGCEDPRLIELEDGTYAVFYTQYHRIPGEKERKVTIGIATSSDLYHWQKLGPVRVKARDGKEFMPRKSAAPVCRVKDGRLVATRINGRYWVYEGEGTISVISSENLRDWRLESRDTLRERAGKFDSDFPECGPPAVVTARGIVLLYNGKNARGDTRAVALAPGTYAAGQALFDATDPTRLLARTDEPFFQPELSWERSGQYVAGTTFIEGIVLFRGQWLLYYGCADSYVGVAVARAKLGELQ